MIQPVKEKIILGIDPGTTIMGYGVLRVAGVKPEMIAMGIIDLRKFGDHYLKLRHIHERVLSIIESYLPDELAIEAPFFGKNVQSMLKLGRAQGVAMAAALSRDIPITEYAPLKIKMAITGNGQASKEQVADMLQRMLHFPKEEMPVFLDATDGLAAAYCHFLQMGRPAAEKGFCLYGNDIDDTTSPIEAGLGWITKFVEGKDFIDRPLMEKQKAEGVTRKLVGFKMIDRGIPRHGYDIADAEGNKIGVVTSGTMSPCLKIGIGMGYVKPEFSKAGNNVYIKVREKLLKAEVVKLPFV